MKKGSPFPPCIPPSFPKTFVREDGRAGDIVGLPLAAGPRRCSCGRGLRHGKAMKGREQEHFLLPVFWSCGLQAVECYGATREIFNFVMASIPGGSGALSASLCWKADSPDAGRMMAGTPYALCSMCLERRYASGRPVSDGDRPYRSEQKFFRGGEERERGRGSFYQKTPLPLSHLFPRFRRGRL